LHLPARDVWNAIRASLWLSMNAPMIRLKQCPVLADVA
jgi:hypothetical protein